MNIDELLEQAIRVSQLAPSERTDAPTGTSDEVVDAPAEFVEELVDAPVDDGKPPTAPRPQLKHPYGTVLWAKMPSELPVHRLSPAPPVGIASLSPRVPSITAVASHPW